MSRVGPHASAKVLRLYSTKAKPRECCVIWLTGMLMSEMPPNASNIVRRSRTSLYLCSQEEDQSVLNPTGRMTAAPEGSACETPGQPRCCGKP